MDNMMLVSYQGKNKQKLEYCCFSNYLLYDQYYLKHTFYLKIKYLWKCILSTQT